ncbi:MAG: transferase [Phycisphaera sp.]|nr:transferase [Phycisphaera sp.]
MANVVVFGTNDFAEVVYAYLRDESEHQVVAFTVEQKYWRGSQFLGLDVVPFEQIAEAMPTDQVAMFVAAGPSRVNKLRSRVFAEAKAKGYRLISHVCSGAHICSNVPYGENCWFFDGVVVEPYCRIGDDNVFWSGAILAHHSTVGNHCFIAPAAAVSGRCVIHDHVFLGINSTVRDHVTIKEGCVIGAGAVIKQDTEPYSVYSQAKTPRFRGDSETVEL